MLTATAFWLITGCATMNVSPEEAVTLRAQERWDVLLADDLEAAYEYLTPGYRSSVSPKGYQRKLLLQPVQWTEAEVRETSCSESTCKVKISIKFTVYGAVPGRQKFDSRGFVDENWIRIDNEWFLAPE
jgi:hypothetical protein